MGRAVGMIRDDSRDNNLARSGLFLGYFVAVWLGCGTFASAQDTIADTFRRAASDKPVAPAVATPVSPATTVSTTTTTTTAAPAVAAAKPAVPAVNPAGTTAALPQPTAQDQAAMQALTDQLAAQAEIDHRTKEEKAFDAAMSGSFPLSPEQIRDVMQRMTATQRAGAPPPAPDVSPVVKVDNISLDPGVTPPLIKVAVGYVTTVNILDVTGQPWPIQDVAIGGNFDVPGPNDAHVLRIIPQTRFGKGNLSVRLVGLTTPVTFRVESGKDEIYYRYDVRIPKTGPAAQVPLISRGIGLQAGDDTLMTFLDGLPPKEAKALTIDGADRRTKAWKVAEVVYLRTPLTLLSPSWDSSARSADGTNVYALRDTPIIMLSDNGQLLRAHVVTPPEDPFRGDTASGMVTEKVTVPVNPTAAAAPVVESGLVPVGAPVATTTANTTAASPPATVAPQVPQRPTNSGVQIINPSNYQGNYGTTYPSTPYGNSYVRTQ